MHELKNETELKYIRQSCRIIAELLEYLREIVKIGVTTEWLDKKAEAFIEKRGAIPAFKNYKGFPATICSSINEEVIHGIPGVYRLQEGDILSVDVGVNTAGYFGDAAVTIPVGRISEVKRKLLETTERALYAGIEKAVHHNHVADISRAVQNVVEGDGFSIVRDFVGHGVGKRLHEEPRIPNFKAPVPGKGPRLRAGMTLAIEPMVNVGGYEVYVSDDKWTVVTKDGTPSAHFEHTILVRDGEPDILTLYR